MTQMERPRLSPRQTRRAMKLSILDGMAANMSENMFGPFVSLFALSLGANKTQIGLLTAIPSLLGNACQLPAAILVEKLGRRKIVSVVGGTIARFLILTIALLPFWGLSPTAMIGVFLLLVSLRGLFGSIGSPGWTAMMGEICPPDRRGSFFGTRNIMSSLTGLVGTLIAGRLIGYYGFPFGYQVSFFSAFIMGVISVVLFAAIPVIEPVTLRRWEAQIKGTVPEPKRERKPLKESLVGFLAVFSGYSTFRKYCLTSLLWNFSVSLAGSLIAVYFAEVLGGTAAQWSIVNSVGLFSTMICQKYWGVLADRHGSKNIMTVGGIGAASLPLLWLMVPAPQFGPIAIFIGNFAWGGYNLAAFNLLLEITPDEGRPTFVGVYNTLQGLATSIAPMLGGMLADRIGVQYVLLISGIMRWIGYLVFVKTIPNDKNRPMRPSDLLPSRFQKAPTRVAQG